MPWLWQGGNSPGDVPYWAYRHLVTELKVGSDSLTDLRAVVKVGFVDGVLVDFIRIFDPEVARKVVRVTDFTSLDQHPELIIYEGYMESQSGKIYMVARPHPAKPALA